MIVIISGGIGSGKSLTAVRYAARKSLKNEVIANFTLKKVKYTKLKYGDVIEVTKDEKGRDVKKVNWDYWKQHKNSDVLLDEAHGIKGLSSRSSMSKSNQLFSEWFAQVRKIFGNTGDQNYIKTMQKLNNNAFQKYFDAFMDKSNNFLVVTQKPRKIEINLRELSHIFINCEKIKVNDENLIINNCFFGSGTYDAIEAAEMGQKPKRFIFRAEPYYKMYDSYELINFDAET